VTKTLECFNDKRWVILVFVSLVFMSFGAISHNAFADQVSTTISLGNQLLGAVAVNPDTNKIYVDSPSYSASMTSCCPPNNKVFVINGSSDTILGNVTVGTQPADVGINPITNRIYVSNWSSSGGSVSVIDGTTDKVIDGISSVGDPENLAVNPNTNKIYVDGTDSHNVYVVDGVTDNVVDTIQLGGEPGSIVVNPNTDKIYVNLFSNNNNTVSVIDGSTNRVTNTIPTGDISLGIAVNPNTNKIYVTNFGSCSPIYCPSPPGSTVSVIDGSTNSVTNTIQVGQGPRGISVNPSINRVYVTNEFDRTVSVIDGSTNAVVNTIPVGSEPIGVGVNLNTNKIYAANHGCSCSGGTGSVTVIQGISSGTTTSSAPQNLQSSAGNSQVTLSWTAPSSNGGSTITGYNVYRGTTSGGESITPIATSITSTSYTDGTVTNGQTYFYKVTAINSAGESASSNEASATPTAPATISSAPTGLTANTISSSQINLSWIAPNNNGGSAITGYDIERSTDNGSTWSTVQSNTGSTATTYNDTELASSTTYTYRVSAVNSVGTSQPSNVSSATTSAVTPPPPPAGITLNNIQSTSGTVSSSNQMTLANFNAGTGSNRLLVVGISANNNNAISVTFGGVSLTQAAGSFYNNDVEFWYLKNPTGTGNVVVTTGGPTQAVVGAYSFAGVNQTTPIPTHVTKHNTTPNSPNIAITTKFANDWVLDLPSIYGDSTLGSSTCTQQWDVNMPSAITGASSSKIVSTPGVVNCKWAASSADFWDDVAIEIRASQ